MLIDLSNSTQQETHTSILRYNIINFMLRSTDQNIFLFNKKKLNKRNHQVIINHLYLHLPHRQSLLKVYPFLRSEVPLYLF